MNCGKLFLTFIFLFQIAAAEVFAVNDMLKKSPAKTILKNPFRSLLPTNNNLTPLAQSLSKNTIQKNDKTLSLKKKENNKKLMTKEPEVLPEQRTDISSQGKKLFQSLKLKDILETSEGRYALIDENKITYFVQEGEWLNQVLLKQLKKNSAELKEIDGETTIILKLQD
ncbi:MAG: hypothetical protein H8E38_03185 [SAR324 cluster bacterium]|nr:hypothetical protein [SAR324 cluster bacterium]MBL7035105.1 hypothetical protein [SAR324 cluster bacterium]